MSKETHLALGLLAALTDRFGASSKVSREIPSWIEYITEVDCPERPAHAPVAPWWKKVRSLVQGLVPGEPGPEERTIQRNVDFLAKHFGLSPVETKALFFNVCYQTFDAFEHVVDQAISTRELSYMTLIAFFCGADETEMRRVLRPTARLHMSGLLVPRGGFGRDIPVEVVDRLSDAMLAEVEDVDALIGLIFPPAKAPEAEWCDFEGMGADAAFLKELIGRALREARPGVNVLLYGPPGTGKTEFCKVLAQELGASLRTIGETDSSGDEPMRGQRLSELTMAGRMLDRRRDTILLFDEMEDLVNVSPFQTRGTSKVFVNRLFETNPIPTLWTTNSVEDCDPAVLRRMTFSVMMRPPVGSVRARIWERLDARHKPGIPAGALARLAAEHEEAPALVSDAMAVARLCEGGEAVVTRVLDAATMLGNGGTRPVPKLHPEVSWQPDLANADSDLALLEARLAREDAPRRVSFCLEGPPGTGKSAWARHLAQRIGLPVLEKRASDLMSKWVGESERNIAKAFAEAREAGALLIFDEADSLLADRQQASQSWQVSQVNEMLTWMESHPLPFVCTTNFAAHLDAATQRRFTFRIRFDWLRTEQLIPAWRAHFEADPPQGLRAFDRLAPGDFAIVRRRMQVLGETDPTRILAELAREAEGHEGAPRLIGFGRQER